MHYSVIINARIYFFLFQAEIENEKLQSRQKGVEKVFTPNQLDSLAQSSVRSHKWDAKTVQQALQMKFTCGTTGYKHLLEQGMPLPSIRTLQRRLEQVPFSSGILSEVFSYMKVKVKTVNKVK